MKKGNYRALLPIAVFLAIFLGAGLLTGDFYKMPAIVAFLIAVIVAFLQNRKVSFNEKIEVISKSVGDPNIITMCLVFLAAGGFSGAVTAAGGVESTVNLGLSILPSPIAVVGLLIISGFISISMGTSMGTVAALAPIAIGISEKTNISLAVCIGAVVCGAMFGDNLSVISDTTIAAVRTQGCDMRDKFKENFIIVLPAIILTIIYFYLITQNAGYQTDKVFEYNFLKVVPYMLVLVGALMGGNVFVILIFGTVASLLIGVVTGSILFTDIFKVIGDGITSMYDITVISIIVTSIVALVKHYGGIEAILSMINSLIRTKKGAQLGIALLSFLVDMATANNTVAIVIAGPIAKDVAEKYGISKRKCASLLDIFTSGAQGLIPYGAQLLSAATLTSLTPFDILPYMVYPFLMCVSAVVFIMFSGRRENKKV